MSINTYTRRARKILYKARSYKSRRHPRQPSSFESPSESGKDPSIIGFISWCLHATSFSSLGYLFENRYIASNSILDRKTVFIDISDHQNSYIRLIIRFLILATFGSTIFIHLIVKVVNVLCLHQIVQVVLNYTRQKVLRTILAPLN